MAYQAVVFDVDDTLLDYALSERRVFEIMLAHGGVIPRDELLDKIWELSWSEWEREGLNDTQSPVIQREYHQRYHGYLRRFLALVNEFATLSMEPEEQYRFFIQLLSEQNVMIPGALELCRNLAMRSRLYLATNNLSQVQRPRVQVFLPYMAGCFISEEVGAIKPSRMFFDRILEQIALPANECLMVGDSLHSDIAGAGTVGMHTCWFRFRRKEACCSIVPTYIADNLGEVEEIVLKGPACITAKRPLPVL